jgi:hypothetical protein
MIAVHDKTVPSSLREFGDPPFATRSRDQRAQGAVGASTMTVGTTVISVRKELAT